MRARAWLGSAWAAIVAAAGAQRPAACAETGSTRPRGSELRGDVRLRSRVILIDGPMLAKLMIDHGVGVSATRSYELRKIDHDYFAED